MEEKDALDVVNHAYENGVTFFDTSDFYGTEFSNEKLLGSVWIAHTFAALPNASDSSQSTF